MQPLRFSVGEHISRFPGRLSTEDMVLLAGALAVRMRGSSSRPTSTSPNAIREWLASSVEESDDERNALPNTANYREWFLDRVVLEIQFSALEPQVLSEIITALQTDLLNGLHRALADELAQSWNAAERWFGDAPPSEIAALLVDLTRTIPGMRVRCVGPASDSAAIVCLQTGRIPVLDAESPPHIVFIYALLTDTRLELVERASDRDSSPCVAVPRRAPPDWISEHAIALEQGFRRVGGPVVVLVQNRILFARATVARELRRSLIESGHVRAIIAFPPGTLTASASPFSIVVFDREHSSSEHITFIKADEDQHFNYARGQLRTREGSFTGAQQILHALVDPQPALSWCRQVPHAEIAQNDYLLAADRYLGTEVQLAVKRAAKHRFLVAIGDIATVIKAQTLRSLESESGVPVREVSPGEFPQHGYLDGVLRVRLVNPADRERVTEQFVRTNDLLLSTKGTIGRTTLAAPRDSDIPIVPSPSTVILRLRNDGPIRDPVVLLMCLRSPLFQSLLRSVVVGTTIPNVSLFDLRKLPVIVGNSDEQRRLRQVFEEQAKLQLQIGQLQDQQAAMAQETWTALDLGKPEKNS